MLVGTILVGVIGRTGPPPARAQERDRPASQAPAKRPRPGSRLIFGRRQTCHFRKRATSVPAEGPAYRLDFAKLFDFVNFPSELCRRRSGMVTEVARLVLPE